MTDEEILYKYLGHVALTNQQAVKYGMIAAMKEWGDQRFIEGRKSELDKYEKVENAYVEDCFYDNGDSADGRYMIILIPKDLQP